MPTLNPTQIQQFTPKQLHISAKTNQISRQTRHEIRDLGILVTFQTVFAKNHQLTW